MFGWIKKTINFFKKKQEELNKIVQERLDKKKTSKLL